MNSVFRKNKKLLILTTAVLVIALGGLLYQTHLDGTWNIDRVRARIDIYQVNLVLNRSPDDYDALIRLGVNYYVIRDFNKSSEAYSRAIEVNPDSFVAWNNLGNVRRDLVSFWDAEDAYQKALEINPHYIASYINLADLYIIWPMDEEGDKKERRIVPLLQQGIKSNPESEELQQALKAYISANK